MRKKNTENKTQISEEKFGIPVVSVLGHVDHGKTSLLDAIRKTNIVAKEHGGITQRIGASTVEVSHENKMRRITFIDTPGHLAFSQMRSRGASVSDVGLLIISSVDGVMPQTKESISHILSSNIPFIVVLTKVDLPTKNIEKTKQQLENEKVLLEGRGGDTPVIEVSAKLGNNIKELLALILLVYDMKGGESYAKLLSQAFKAVVIESRLDTKKGSLATIVVRNGSVAVRDELLASSFSCKVRSLINDKGEQVKQAIVGEAIEVLGFENVPSVGSIVHKKSELNLSQPKELAQKDLKAQIKEYSTTALQSELAIVLCADTQGSLEAIISSLPKGVTLISQKTADVSEADVLLAKSTGAIILGFNVRIRNDVAKLADIERVLLKNYTIIYEFLDEVEDVLEGKRSAGVEKIFGKVQILASFPFEKTFVLGVKVLEGRIARGDKVRLIRGEEVIGESSVSSLRQGREVVSKVEQGKEGGILLSPSLDFTIGDVLLCHA